MVVTDLTSAETIKVASNVFLAAKITFANEISRLTAATGADAQAVVDGAPSPVPAEQSLQVMTILDGIYRSQEAGGEIRLD